MESKRTTDAKIATGHMYTPLAKVTDIGFSRLLHDPSESDAQRRSGRRES